MKTLTMKLIGSLIAVWLLAVPFSAQAEPATICHNIGPGEETLVYEDGVIPNGHQSHINNGTDANGHCDEVGDRDEDGVPNGDDVCPDDAGNGCEDQPVEPVTICHAIGPGEETQVYEDGEIPAGHQTHIDDGTDAVGDCADVGDRDEDGVPNGGDSCPDEAAVNDEDGDGCEDVVTETVAYCHNIGVEQTDEVVDAGSEAHAEHIAHVDAGTDAEGTCALVGDQDGDGVRNDAPDLCPDDFAAPEEDLDGDGCVDDDGTSGEVFGDAGLCDELLLTEGCIDADKAALKVKSFKKLVWKWKGDAGDMTEPAGSPTTSDDYSFCVYVTSGDIEPVTTRVRNSLLPAGAFAKPAKEGWKTKTRKDLSLKAHKYKSKSSTPDGVKKAVVKNSLKAGKDVAKVKSLFPPELADLDTDSTDVITVQLRSSNEGGLCLQSTHAEPFNKSTSSKLKDKYKTEPEPAVVVEEPEEPAPDLG